MMVVDESNIAPVARPYIKQKTTVKVAEIVA